VKNHLENKREDGDKWSHQVIGAAMEVHRHLGPGLLESAYEECLCHELNALGVPFERQKELPVSYKGISLDCGYRMDIVVDRTLLLELKSVETLLPIHEAQLLTYLRLSGMRLGLLVNFNVPLLKNGIKRMVDRF
jgi:GxxExxY protein